MARTPQLKVKLCERAPTSTLPWANYFRLTREKCWTCIVVEVLRSSRMADAVISAVQHQERHAHLEEHLVDFDEHVEDGDGSAGLDAAAVDQRIFLPPLQHLSVACFAFVVQSGHRQMRSDPRHGAGQPHAKRSGQCRIQVDRRSGQHHSVQQFSISDGSC